MQEKATDLTRVGILGLGLLGGAFARHLIAAGIRTFGYDVSHAQMDALNCLGGHSRASARAVAEQADIVITSLPHSMALEQVLLGDDGIAAAGRPALIVIETSTLAIETKEQARVQLAAAGIRMLDAPISGTGAQAQHKDITVLVSGERTDFETTRDLLSHVARSVRYVGEFGDGSKIKLIANLLVAIHTLAAAEAMVLGESAGLDPATLLEVLTDSAATSRMLEVRGPSMAHHTYATPMIRLDVFQKDLDLIWAFARQWKCAVPLFSASVPWFTAAGAQNMGGYDNAAVVSILRQMAGTLPETNPADVRPAAASDPEITGRTGNSPATHNT